jgi:hypothetical protein
MQNIGRFGELLKFCLRVSRWGESINQQTVMKAFKSVKSFLKKLQIVL